MVFLLNLSSHLLLKKTFQDFFQKLPPELDKFAVYTVGPAYGWAHLYLVIKRGHPNPFQVSSSKNHPSDEARMQVILKGLALIGFEDLAQDIYIQWQNFLRLSSPVSDPIEYKNCFPEVLLNQFVQNSLEGVKAMGCFSNFQKDQNFIRAVLNQAWEKFHQSPQDYPLWEQQAILKLNQHQLKTKPSIIKNHPQSPTIFLFLSSKVAGGLGDFGFFTSKILFLLT